MLADRNTNGKNGSNREKRLQLLQQATVETLINLAETDNLPMTVQMVLLNIISTTGVEAGAIRLGDGEDYIFAAQEKIAHFEKDFKTISLGCHFDSVLTLTGTSDQGEILPCMFSRELTPSSSFFCTSISDWYRMEAKSLGNQHFCKKCLELGHETMAMVPIRAVGKTLGLTHLYDSRKKAFSADEITFLKTISSPLGYALKHLQDKESICRSEEQFRFLAENARDIIFRLQIFPERKFIYVSPASAFISGYSPKEYYTGEAFDKKLFHPADYPRYKDIIENNRTDFSKPIILRLIRKDGRIIWVELHCTPICHKSRVEMIEGIARDITGRIQAEEELKASYDKLKAFSSMILNVQEEERTRLSRELHDEVGQALTAIKINLQVTKKELRQRDLDFEDRLSDSIGLVDSILEFVRRQATSLRPPALDQMGLLAAVQNMARGFSRRTGIEAKITAAEEMNRFSSEIETALFRCIQESLTNVSRHSGAKKVLIIIECNPGSIEISIEDDGKGFEPDTPSPARGHLGLLGMQERVKLLSGRFKIDSKPGCGTRITITLPLEQHFLNGE